MRKLFVGSLVALSFVLLSASAWAVAISSATIDYTNNTVTINGFGFGTKPVVYLNAPVPNATYFKNYLLASSVSATSKTSQTITAHLNAYTTALPAGTYELIVINPGVGGARYELTCGAASGADVGALTTRFTNLSTSETAALNNYSINLNNEINRAEGAEGTLTTDLGATNSNLTAETNRAEAAEGGLQTSINGLKTSVKNLSTPALLLLKGYIKTIAVGNQSMGIAFDGTNMWVANWGDNNVSVINAFTGQPAIFSPVNVGNGPQSVAFDGTNMWVTNEGSNNVSTINAATGVVVNTVAVGTYPSGIAFDGTNMWVVNSGSNNASVINVATGQAASFSPIAVGASPSGVAFDGTNMWVANGDNTVTRIPAR